MSNLAGKFGKGKHSMLFFFISSGLRSTMCPVIHRGVVPNREVPGTFFGTGQSGMHFVMCCCHVEYCLCCMLEHKPAK